MPETVLPETVLPETGQPQEMQAANQTQDEAEESQIGGWFDNHCHLTTVKRDPAEVVAEAVDGGVSRMLTVGCDVADSKRAIEIASGFDNVWATAGVHPHEAKDGVAGLEELLSDDQVVAVGECGLDFHYDNSPRREQAEVFRLQIDMALRLDMALVIHTREAWTETFEILDEVGMPERTVFHCFTGGPAEAEACLERGAFLSFSGIVTFPSAKELREAARLTPTARTLIETDSPFLTPVPHRGQPNRPALVSFVGKEVANLQQIVATEMATASWVNGQQLYGL